jgi:hypothetical protein
MTAEDGGSEEKRPVGASSLCAELWAGSFSDPISRIFLAITAIAALVLAVSESHEVIGGALVGAAVAFGLGAAFYDRVVELGPKGVRLREFEKLEEAADRDLSGADPQERDEVLAKGREILITSRSEGEAIRPGAALREAKIEWEYNGLAVQYRFASWLVSRGWTVSEADRLIGAAGADLVAERDGQRIAVEVKVGRVPLGAAVVDQVVRVAASVEAVLPDDVSAREVTPVLVFRGIAMTAVARDRAEAAGVSVYEMDEDGEISHFFGPELG